MLFDPRFSLSVSSIFIILYSYANKNSLCFRKNNCKIVSLHTSRKEHELDVKILSIQD